MITTGGMRDQLEWGHFFSNAFDESSVHVVNTDRRRCLPNVCIDQEVPARFQFKYERIIIHYEISLTCKHALAQSTSATKIDQDKPIYKFWFKQLKRSNTRNWKTRSHSWKASSPVKEGKLHIHSSSKRSNTKRLEAVRKKASSPVKEGNTSCIYKPPGHKIQNTH
jgi:hypothetical protein